MTQSSTTFVARVVLFIGLPASVCFPQTIRRLCQSSVCNNVRLERRWRGGRGGRGREEKNWNMKGGDREKRRGAVVFALLVGQWRSWNVPSMGCQSNCSLPVCLSLCLSSISFLSALLFSSSLLLSSLKQSPPLFLHQRPALCRREARLLLCGRSRLSDCCSVIVSKWIFDQSNRFQISISGLCGQGGSSWPTEPPLCSWMAFMVFMSLKSPFLSGSNCVFPLCFAFSQHNLSSLCAGLDVWLWGCCQWDRLAGVCGLHWCYWP